MEYASRIANNFLLAFLNTKLWTTSPPPVRPSDHVCAYNLLIVSSSDFIPRQKSGPATFTAPDDISLHLHPQASIHHFAAEAHSPFGMMAVVTGSFLRISHEPTLEHARCRRNSFEN
jgi:hypothetical protein